MRKRRACRPDEHPIEKRARNERATSTAEEHCDADYLANDLRTTSSELPVASMSQLPDRPLTRLMARASQRSQPRSQSTLAQSGARISRLLASSMVEINVSRTCIVLKSRESRQNASFVIVKFIA
ncbi:hypothetical protein QAD02_020863 [Eretmocerus hayati]|uniref:Uncharacterized protein n=1 Tax=Eretmocerus hayati TaxID=131215 RepID=A0ACC2PNU0_9HYME|nr:hypothetical protein QAD02_020863 [Eretmocerus hayati]